MFSLPRFKEHTLFPSKCEKFGFKIKCVTIAKKQKWRDILCHQLTHLSFIGWGRQWHPTPILLPGESHGRRSLVGCSPWGHEESDTTERLHFHFSLSCTGEGSGNPLQCSCLENPRDGGAWWAAVYGVAQRPTWLKWLAAAAVLLVMYMVQTLQKGSWKKMNTFKRCLWLCII